jgi:hypothetical protein
MQLWWGIRGWNHPATSTPAEEWSPTAVLRLRFVKAGKILEAELSGHNQNHNISDLSSL